MEWKNTSPPDLQSVAAAAPDLPAPASVLQPVMSAQALLLIGAHPTVVFPTSPASTEPLGDHEVFCGDVGETEDQMDSSGHIMERFLKYKLSDLHELSLPILYLQI